MWQTLSTFKENLSQIASDVLDAAEELETGRLEVEAEAEENGDSAGGLEKKNEQRQQQRQEGGDSAGGLEERNEQRQEDSDAASGMEEKKQQWQEDGVRLGSADLGSGMVLVVEEEEEEEEEEGMRLNASATIAEAGTAALGIGIGVGKADAKSLVRAESSALRAQRQKVETLTAQLEAVCAERDNAVRDLQRLKQHLLDKEMADSQKMEEDWNQISDLESRSAQLEKALARHTQEHKEEVAALSSSLQQVTADRDALRLQLQRSALSLQAKDSELSNLQSALGQYYAEMEARDRLYQHLAAAKDQIATLSDQLRFCRFQADAAAAARDAALQQVAALKERQVQNEAELVKVEEEVSRLRQALEQSISRLNRMSTDSGFSVDRRIVIKLLVTYFHRNHSREVLDLMVRMLGFSEEEKRQVGLAQQSASRNSGSGGIVSGVFGRPARFVGGLRGSGSGSVREASAVSSKDGSFADLWIDFLLKESEEREREMREKTKSGVNGGAATKPEPVAPASMGDGQEEFVSLPYR